MARALWILAIVLVVVGFITGVIHYTRTDDSYQFSIDRHKLRDVTGKAKQEGRQAVKRAGEALERTGEKLQEPAAAPPPRPVNP